MDKDVWKPMQMPLPLQEAVEALLNDIPPSAVREAAAALSLRYRTDEKAPAGTRLLSSREEMRAYCAFRMPATYAALVRTMEMLRESGVESIGSLLDVGSGTGSALWAAKEIFGVKQACLVERESGMIELAQRLAKGSMDQGVQWLQGDMLKAPLQRADLVTASFCLGELHPEDAENMVHRLWEAAGRALLIVEPGTPAGHSRIRRYAAILRSLGANMAAPCPSMGDCPIREDDWCNFSVRIERSRLQRFLRDGTLPYEDAKFSFLAVTREEVQPAAVRIRRHPKIRGGFVELPVCREDGEETIRVTRKHPHYKAARKAEAGDRWED